jgi:hypothetical protein
VRYGPGGPFSYGPPGPSPMGQTAPPAAKKLANACAKVSTIGSIPEAQGPMSVCQLRDLATKKGVETLPRRVRTYPKTIYAARGLCGWA